MRILLSLLISFMFSGCLFAQTWQGTGTYDDPYVYTSPVVNNESYIIVRGQALYDNQFVIGADRVTEAHYRQLQTREDFRILVMGLGLMRAEYVGTGQDIEHLATAQQDPQNNWVTTFEVFTDKYGTMAEFPNVQNPPEIIGQWHYDTMESKMTQDIGGVVGTLTVRTQVEKKDPNANNLPLVDNWRYEFTFDLPSDAWTASVHREVNGTLDMQGNDAGSWNPYGAGTTINLPNPTQPLSGLQSDWYLDGTYADDAWTLLNNVHYHPGPITFSFAEYTQAFLTEYKP